MNNDILCICYSRTGRTRQTMAEIAAALDCELLELHDHAHRTGAMGWLRCGLDAMRKKTIAVNRIETPQPLWKYKLVILGTPVWAGRCSSVMRAFLKRRGLELDEVAYVITHSSDEPYREVFDQMDQYLESPHVAEVSLRPGSAGYIFWRDQFLKTCADFVGCELLPVPEETETAETVETVEAMETAETTETDKPAENEETE